MMIPKDDFLGSYVCGVSYFFKTSVSKSYSHKVCAKMHKKCSQSQESFFTTFKVMKRLKTRPGWHENRLQCQSVARYQRRLNFQKHPTQQNQTFKVRFAC